MEDICYVVAVVTDMQRAKTTVVYDVEIPQELLRRLGVEEGGELPPQLREIYVQVYLHLHWRFSTSNYPNVTLGVVFNKHNDRDYIVKLASLALLFNERMISVLLKKLIDITYKCMVEGECSDFPEVKKAQERLKFFTDTRMATIQLGNNYMKVEGSDAAIRIIEECVRGLIKKGVLKDKDAVIEAAVIIAEVLKRLGMVVDYKISE